MLLGFSFRQFALSAQVAALSLVLAACNPSAGTGGENASSSAASQPAQSSRSSATAVMEKRYMDGTYSAVGNYRSPNGAESVNVTLTLEDGIITAAEFDGNATHEISVRMQGNFSQGFESEVVGKSIDELDLTVVNGSSLTPGGFMDAVEQIKAEAAVS